MRKLLAAALVLTLTACTPALQRAAPAVVDTATSATQLLQHVSLTRDVLSLLLNNTGSDALTGNGTPGDGPGLVVTGENIRPDEAAQAWCKPLPVAAAVRWSCNLPDVPAAQRLRVTFVPVGPGPAAIVQASGFAYRPSAPGLPVFYELR